MRQLIIKCDNGHLATIRPFITVSEINQLNQWNGLSQPALISGTITSWWSFCRRLVHLGIAAE
jgi:hypothetical protein